MTEPEQMGNEPVDMVEGRTTTATVWQVRGPGKTKRFGVWVVGRTPPFFGDYPTFGEAIEVARREANREHSSDDDQDPDPEGSTPLAPR